ATPRSAAWAKQRRTRCKASSSIFPRKSVSPSRARRLPSLRSGSRRPSVRGRVRDMSDKITFTIDGRTVEATPDGPIWQDASRSGVDIPHLCYAPEADYRPDGNCRACMVEIEGERVLQASCLRKPTEGMKVHVGTERAKASRRMVFELLLADQPARDEA